MITNLQSILDGLKKRTSNSNNGIVIQKYNGEIVTATCEFNPPANEEAIKCISDKYGVTFPNDYVDFLRIHNGAKLFDVGFGEFLEIFDLERVDEYSALMPDTVNGSLIPIAHCPSCTIFLDTTREQTIFINDSSSDFTFLSMNFEEWLEAIIMANGHYFWDWTPQMLYRTIDNRELQVKDWLLTGFK